MLEETNHDAALFDTDAADLCTATQIFCDKITATKNYLDEILRAQDCNSKPEIVELHNYCAEGDLENTQRLIEDQHVPVDTENKYLDTALHYAARGGHERIVKYLLSKGANVNHCNSWNESPLMWGTNHILVVNELLNAGASLMYKNRINGNSVLDEDHGEEINSLLRNHARGGVKCQ